MRKKRRLWACRLLQEKKSPDYYDFRTPAILENVMTNCLESKHVTLPKALSELILDSSFWAHQSVLSSSIPIGIQKIHDLFHRKSVEEIKLGDLQGIINLRPINGSKKYNFFSHKRREPTENFYIAINKASTWENLLSSTEFGRVLSERHRYALKQKSKKSKPKSGASNSSSMPQKTI